MIDNGHKKRFMEIVEWSESYGKRESIAELRGWGEVVILNRMVRVSLVGRLKFKRGFQWTYSERVASAKALR